MTTRNLPHHVFPLTATCPGQRVRVYDVQGGDGLRGRLCAMGLAPGTPVDVVAIGQGPVILNVMGSRIMIGYGMAAKLMVRELNSAMPRNKATESLPERNAPE